MSKKGQNCVDLHAPALAAVGAVWEPPLRWMQSIAALSLRARVLAFVAVALLVGGCTKKPEENAAPPPPPAVTVAEVDQQTIPITMEFSGTVKSIKTVDIIPRVSGYIEERYFTEGSYVEKGELLYLIDPKPFQARLDAYQAQLEKDEASLAFWNNEEARYTRLAKQGAASEEDKEKAITRRKETDAAIAKDKADIENAKLELSYTKITAPFTGRIQQTRVNVGQLVRKQQDVLTTLVQVDPIYVVFNVSRAQLYKIQRLIDAALAPEDLGDYKSVVTMPDGSEYPHQGTLDYVSAEINPQTDTLEARMVFPNPHKMGYKRALISGQYVPLRLTVGKQPNALLIPQPALVETQAGTHVYVVTNDKVAQRKVDVSHSYQHYWVIENGVKPGERVIVEGVQKVKPGLTVQIKTRSEKKG